MSIDALGFVGGILLVIGFIPQVYIAFIGSIVTQL